VLLFDPSVCRAAANGRLGPGPRFAAQRWAELLDANTHFSQSATAVVPPTTLLRELLESGRAFMSTKKSHHANMLECFQQTRVLLQLEPNLREWFPRERDALVAALKATQPIPSNVARDDQRDWVAQRTKSIAKGPLTAFGKVVADPATGYRQRLIEAITAQFIQVPVDVNGWRRFDEHLTYLAAIALSEGRGGRWLAIAAADAIAAAASDADAADAFSLLVASGEERFTVAVILNGAKSIRNLDAFGCVKIEQRPVWPGANGSVTGPKLDTFVAQRQHASRTSWCGVFVAVEAFDPEHARAKALSLVERLEDHIAAEHRVATFQIGADVLVYRAETSRTQLLRRDSSSVPQARPLGGRNLAPLERSLRFHKLARTEPTPVLGVVQSWIALENLAESAKVLGQTLPGQWRWKSVSPTSFLPDHVGAITFLAAARNQIISGLHIVRKGARGGGQKERWLELETWLGVQPGRHWFVDLERWVALLKAEPAQAVPARLQPDASAEHAAALLRKVVVDLPPYVSFRLDETRRMVCSPGLLLFSSSRAQQRATANVSRIRLLRHRVVHGAMPENESAKHVAEAGRHLLDAVFEVIPNWLNGDGAWRALYDARAWQGTLKKSWGVADAVLDITPDEIARGRKK
jgi:hypothetical protein